MTTEVDRILVELEAVTAAMLARSGSIDGVVAMNARRAHLCALLSTHRTLDEDDVRRIRALIHDGNQLLEQVEASRSALQADAGRVSRQAQYAQEVCRTIGGGPTYVDLKG